MDLDSTKLNKFHVEHKLKDGRQMSLKHNVETGRLREMLREKCRIRVKEARQKNFNDSRCFLIEQKCWIAEVIRDELKEFEENISLQETIYNELVEEFYQWLVEQYELEVNYYAESDTGAPTMICPVCQKAELNLETNILHCNCGLRLPYNNSLQYLWNRIQSVVTQHETRCNLPLNFFLEPNSKSEQSMNSFCDKCDYYSTIIE